jgi:hypothetical protein
MSGLVMSGPRLLLSAAVAVVCGAAAAHTPEGPYIFRVNVGEDLQAACDTAAAAAHPHPREVLLASGVHRISRPLTLTAAHSGLRLRGESGAVVDGGLLLPPFTAQANGTWTTTLPPTLLPANVTQLFVGGGRRLRARTPNAVNFTLAGQFSDDATLHMASPLENCSTPVGGVCPDVDKLGFVYDPRDPHGAPSGSDDLSAAWVLTFASWTAEWHAVGSVNETNSTLLFAEPAQSPVGRWGMAENTPGGGRWVLENSLAFLDAPGEFFVASWGTVYYIPLPGETPATAPAVIPLAPSLLVVSGGSIFTPVVGLSVTGVAFQHFAEASGGARLGSHYPVNAAVQLAYATGLLLQDVNVSNGGGSGVILEAGLVNLTLDRLAISDVGGNGVSGLLVDGTPLNLTDVTLSNSTISETGSLYFNQPCGIGLAGLSGIRVLHNEVSGGPYGAILVGWQKGTTKNSTAMMTTTAAAAGAAGASPVFEIGFNFVHNYGQGVLSDFGGIYTSALGGCWDEDPSQGGCYTPTLVHDNYVTGGRRYNYGANGAYMDEGISGVTFDSNVFADVGATAVYFHCGMDNTATNNVLYGAQAQGGGPRSVAGLIGGCNTGGFTPPDTSLVTFEGNILVGTNTPWMFDGSDDVFVWPGNDVWVSDRNVFWGTGPWGAPPLHYPNGSVGLPAWRAVSGGDANSVEGDPLFADPAGGNFTVLPGSPALPLGWRQVDVSRAGVVPRGG